MRPIDRILERLEHPRRSGKGWAARCPAHDDRRPSLTVTEGDDGRVLLRCFAGCSVEAIVAAVGLELADLFEDEGKRGSTHRGGCQARQVVQVGPRLVASHGVRVDTSIGLTLEALAEAKGLPVDLLEGLGCETVRYFGQPAVQVPYHDEQGEIVGIRYRLSLGGQFRWKKGTKASTLLYGANRLDEIREAGFVLVVEGESDAWTLIHYGFPVVAVPGAGMWTEHQAERLGRPEAVYVVVEPDKGGETLVGKLRDSALRPRVKLIRLPTKDVSELHLLDAGLFPQRLREAMEDATTLLAEEEERRRTQAEADWISCSELALEPNILELFAAELHSRGFVGSTNTPKLIFLVLMSRLLPRPVSLVLRGLSSAGKSYNVESVLPFFPESAYFSRSGMSERALVYSEEDFRHRILYIAEAEAVAGESLSAYFLRTLISENKLVYETTEKDGEHHVTRVIEKPGPTGVILTTTRLRLNPQNETRMLALTVSDDPELTRAIMEAIAQKDEEAEEAPPAEAWLHLQSWLELGGERRVTDEGGFLLALARLVPFFAVRLRRDFSLIRSLVFSHAILHQASRCRDERGRIIATLADYDAIRDLVANIVAEGIGANVSDDVRETVAAVAAAITKTEGEKTVRRAEVQDELGLDDRATNRRLGQACEGGFVENTNPGRGKSGLYKLGNPIPDSVEVLATVDEVRRRLDNLDNLAADEGAGDPLLRSARHDSIPLVGDHVFRTQINKSHELGLITSRERLERIRVHDLIVGSRPAAGEQLILDEPLAEGILHQPEGDGP